MKNGAMQSQIWGVKKEEPVGSVGPACSSYVGIVLSTRGGLSMSCSVSPDEAREIAADMIAAANLAEGGKA